MRTASTSIPRWIDAPLESPLPPDSPILARWSAVRNCLPPLAELLDVDADRIREMALDKKMYYKGVKRKIDQTQSEQVRDTALTYSLRSGQSTMVLSPGEDAVCRAVRAGGTARIWRISPARCPRARTARSWRRLWRSRTTGAWNCS